MLEPVAPVDLPAQEAVEGAEPHAHARERARARFPAIRVPGAAEVAEGSELQVEAPGRVAPERDAELERGGEAVVADERVLAVAAHGLEAADRELLQREERLARELDVRAED